jgi:L-lactate utilization protein LutB
MKDSIQNNILQNKQQIASNLQTDEPKISAKVATSKQTATQHFNSQQQKVDNISDSVIKRTGATLMENTASVFKEGYKVLNIKDGEELWDEIEQGCKALQNKTTNNNDKK